MIRPWRQAATWLLFLAPFFFLTYGFANWITGLRTHVPSVVFGWERLIPFLPGNIVPYWSTDLFYGLSLFLCQTREELNTLGKRLLAAQILCVTGYLVFPLRFTFERPVVNGMFGRMFEALMSFDKPFNQAPSLHVALTAILWVTYSKHIHGLSVILIRGWFLLMALSTLTTWQHHFIDLPTGLWAGLFALALFPDARPEYRGPPSRDPRRYALAAAYLAGAAICVLPICLIGGFAWIFLWPCAALALVSVIYLLGRPQLFGKRYGAMSKATIAVLAPYLAGAWLNSRWHTRGKAPAQEIADGVWLGRIPNEQERVAFQSFVDLTAELPFTSVAHGYRNVPMLDLLAPSSDQLQAAARAIQDMQARRPTLVFCALGYSRSALSVAAWLIESGRSLSVDQAIEQIRAKRPSIVISTASRRALTRPIR